MSTALTKASAQNGAIAALQMNEDELIGVLQTSVYPGASIGSVKLVINVCRAANKDPLKKPYHIVPMLVATGKKKANGYDEKEWRDVIMPGINDYRTDAARTGQHAGTSEPEFGNDVTETLSGVSVTYPAWCRVIVKRTMPNGHVAEFSGLERWKENYATAGRDSEAPNAMWKRRPYAQLAKCAEAQALRKAFPEVGNQPTADEMEGKEIDVTPASDFTTYGAEPTPEPTPAAIQYFPNEEFNKIKKIIQLGKRTKEASLKWIKSGGYTLTPEQEKALDAINEPIQGTATPVTQDVTYADIAARMNHATTIEALDDAADLISRLADESQRNELTVIYRDLRAQRLG